MKPPPSGTQPQKPAKLPEKVVRHQQPSHLENPVTQKNIQISKQNVVKVRNDTKIVKIVNVNSTKVVNVYNKTVINRYTVVNNYYRNTYYHDYYRAYWGRGFYGGYFYPFRPCYDIHTYFYYPVVFWLWAYDYDDYYWQRWYGADYVTYPVRPFVYARVWYPTEVFRDLAIEVSAMPTYTQSYFRTAMVSLTESLAQQLGYNLGTNLVLRENEISVTHYKNLENQAIVMEGSVDIERDGISLHAPFKGLVDLINPNNSMVYVPVGQEPTDNDLSTLDAINQRITQLGGDPLQADIEPQNYVEAE